MSSDSEMFNVLELADYLRMSPVTIYKHAVLGKIPGFKVGAQWRFRKSTIDRLVVEQERKNGNRRQGEMEEGGKERL